MTSTDQLRIAIIGCGAIARGMHLPAVVRTPGVTVGALVDPDIAAAQELAQEFGAGPALSSLRDLPEDTGAVIIATPPHTHVALAKEAFRHGCHVLCEKPLANSVAECEQIVRLAQEASRILAVGHMCRFYPVREALPSLCERHGLGRVIRVTATEGKPYSWPTVTGYTVRREMVPGGVLINAGIHTLDSLLWWFGDPVEFEYSDDAVGGLESNVRLRLTFPGGVDVRFRQSRTCALPYQITVEAERGQISLAANSLTEHRVITDKGTQVCWRGDPRLSHADCHVAQLQDFTTSIRECREPRISGQEGTRVIRLIEACYEDKRSKSLPHVAPVPGVTW